MTKDQILADALATPEGKEALSRAIFGALVRAFKGLVGKKATNPLPMSAKQAAKILKETLQRAENLKRKGTNPSLEKLIGAIKARQYELSRKI